jgi:hypothetical protein
MLRIKKQQIDGTLFFGLKRSEYVATALRISMPVGLVYRTNLANISSIQLIDPCFWMYSKGIPSHQNLPHHSQLTTILRLISFPSTWRIFCQYHCTEPYLCKRTPHRLDTGKNCNMTMQTRDDLWVSWMTLRGKELPKNHYPLQTWGITKEEEQEVVKCKQNFAVIEFL